MKSYLIVFLILFSGRCFGQCKTITTELVEGEIHNIYPKECLVTANAFGLPDTPWDHAMIIKNSLGHWAVRVSSHYFLSDKCVNNELFEEKYCTWIVPCVNIIPNEKIFPDSSSALKAMDEYNKNLDEYKNCQDSIIKEHQYDIPLK